MPEEPPPSPTAASRPSSPKGVAQPLAPVTTLSNVTVRVSQAELPSSARFPVAWLRKVARRPFGCLDKSGTYEISLTLTNDQRIQSLNRDFRGKDEPTDVLSFAATEALDLRHWPQEIPVPLGDIVISLATVERQAQEQKVAVLSELAWVLVHGVLHLLGYDHQTQEQRQVMRGLEIQALKELGIDKVILV